MLVGFKPNLKDQLVCFSALTLLVWLHLAGCNVLSGMLSLYTTLRYIIANIYSLCSSYVSVYCRRL